MSTIYLSLVLVIIGQILNAAIVLIDKYIVTSTTISRSSVYAFYVAIMSAIVIIMVPFGIVHIPSITVIRISLLIGAVFIFSILFLYESLKNASATDVVPWLTAVSTIVTFLLGNIILHEQLPKSFPTALVLIVIGMLLVGHFRFNAKSFIFVVVSGILFGLSAILTKILFQHADFADGFFWSRMGNAVAALALLLWPSCRQGVLHSSKSAGHKTTYLVVLNRVLGGLAFLCILYSIRIGSVSIVNSLSSLQFLFIFVLIFLMRNKMVKQYEHEFRPGHVAHKILAMVFIIAGFFVLFI